MPQELNLDAFFSPRELLEVQAGLYGVPPRERRTMEILDAVGLADKADAYAVFLFDDYAQVKEQVQQSMTALMFINN